MKVGIVGGSVGGLAAARVLRDLGAEVSVFERSAADLADRGAGIALDPSVAQAIGAIQGTAVAGRVILGASGRQLWRRAAAKVVTSWSAVYRALRDRVPEGCVRRGQPVVECSASNTGARLRFSDGTESAFDLVVGADGLGSVVRDAVAPGFAPEYCGYVAVRGVTPEADLPPACEPLRRLADDPGLVNCYGRRTHLVAYWVPFGKRRGLNWMWYRNVAPDDLDRFLWDETGQVHRWSLPPGAMRPEASSALLDEMRFLFPESVHQAAQAAPVLSQQAIYRGVPETLVRGRAILLGDAGHIAVPHIGAGVSLAFQDAMDLAHFLRSGDLDSSLGAWAEARRATAAKALEAAAALGNSLQHEDNNWECWGHEDFEQWWLRIIAGHGLYFESPASSPGLGPGQRGGETSPIGSPEWHRNPMTARFKERKN